MTPAQIPPAHPADTQPARPKSVIVFFAAGYGFLVLAIAVILQMAWDQVHPPVGAGYRWPQVNVGLAAAVLFLTIAMLVLVHRRSKLGQALGVVFMVPTCFPSVIMLWAMVPPPDRAELPIYIGIGMVLLCQVLAVAYWVYAFALSRKARAYFGYKVNLSPQARRADG